MKTKFNAILAVFVICLSSVAMAAQEFDVKDGDAIQVKVSTNDLTRIKVHNGRISKVWGAGGQLHKEPDKKNGEVFVRPMPRAKRDLSFFVQDDRGATYTIIATQYDIPSETVILKPKGAKANKRDIRRYKSIPLVKQVKTLVRSMALGEDAQGYTQEDHEQEIPLWNETDIKLVRVYSGYKLSGEVYRITNVSGETMVFSETEFLDFGEGVLAVSVQNLELPKSDTTFLYIVRKVDEV